MELAGVGAYLQRGMLVVELILEFDAVGLQLGARLGLVAVNGARLRPLALVSIPRCPNGMVSPS